MTTPREPWSKFFWNDWRGDPKLRVCSLGARGLWMDLLAVMHEAEPYGHLLVNGIVPTAKMLAQAVGSTAGEVNRLMGELLAAGVPSVNGDRIWFSRRMVRDKQRKIINTTNGQGGGNPKLRSRITESDNRTSQEPDKPSDKPHAGATGASHIPEARSQKEETPPPSVSPPLEASEDLLAIPKFLKAENREDIPNGRNSRGSRLPADWQPDDADRDYAVDLGLDLARTTADFRDYWHAQAGRDAVKVDWGATWRKWCRRAADERGRSNGNGSKPASTFAAGRRVMARFTGGSTGDLGTSGERLPDDAETQPAGE